MIPPANIFSLTDFRQNAKKLIAKLKTSKEPLALTINGKAEIIIEEASVFEQNQRLIRQLEQEIRALKTAVLKDALAIGAEQAERGEFSHLSFDDIIAKAESEAQKHDAL